MDETITISVKRYERLIAAEFALRVLAERRYQSDRQDVLDAILDAQREENANC
jgi:hypothetical protein